MDDYFDEEREDFQEDWQDAFDAYDVAAPVVLPFENMQDALDAYDADAPEIPSFFGSFAVCMRKYFDISGRASRKEFWSFFALVFPFAWLLLPFYCIWVTVPEFSPESLTRWIFFWIGVSGLSFATATFLPLMAATARRVHDVGVSSSWLVFLFLLWGVGWIAALVILLLPGFKGWNNYGPAPKRRVKLNNANDADDLKATNRDGRPLRTFWLDPTNFHGVADRFEYFGSLLIYLAVVATTMFATRCYVLGLIPKVANPTFGPFLQFSGGLAVLLTISILASTIRRLHDVGYSGLWVLTLLPPATIVGLPFLAFLMFQPPKILGNKYVRRFI